MSRPSFWTVSCWDISLWMSLWWWKKESVSSSQHLLFLLCKDLGSNYLNVGITYKINGIQLLKICWSEWKKNEISQECDVSTLCRIWNTTNWTGLLPIHNTLFKYALEGLHGKETIGPPVTQQCENVIWKPGPADCDTAAKWKFKDKVILPRLSMSAGREQVL